MQNNMVVEEKWPMGKNEKGGREKVENWIKQKFMIK